jgi:hypothetical protein
VGKTFWWKQIMGIEKMRNLQNSNIYRDEGKVSIAVIKQIEVTKGVVLPNNYVSFVINHNGARLNSNNFDYNDPNTNKNEGSIAFINAEKILYKIELIQSGEEPDWPIEYRFEDGLIPFGDNGGGDLICFDYRKDRNTDNPPIVIWNHDMGFEHRVVFIASNFEEFVNMLHEPEDEE